MAQQKQNIDWAAVKRSAPLENCIRSFRYFAERLWPVATGGKRVVWSKHMTAICDEAQSLVEESRRRKRLAMRILDQWGPTAKAAEEIEAMLGNLPPLRLVIMVPPRHSKSTLIGVLLTAWIWLTEPGADILALGATENLVERDGLAMKDVIFSAEYEEIKQYAAAVHGVNYWTIRKDQNAKSKFDTTSHGSRAGYPVGARFTGANCDYAVIDDPHDLSDVLIGSVERIEERMEEVRDWYDNKVLDRLNNKLWGVVICIMQAVHQKDLAHHIATHATEIGARIVCLPAEYNPDHPFRYDKDWRTEKGEPLEPIRFPKSILNIEKEKDPGMFMAKWGQMPVPREGRLFKQWHFDFRYKEDPRFIQGQMDYVWMSADLAFKGNNNSDHVVIQVFGKKGTKFYLLHQFRSQIDFDKTIEVFVNICKMFPTAYTKVFEDKANAPALKSMLDPYIPGIVLFNPGTKDKYTRAQLGTLPVVSAGGLLFPLETYCPWIDGYVKRHLSFRPNGADDDEIDATSQALIYVLTEQEAGVGSINAQWGWALGDD